MSVPLVVFGEASLYGSIRAGIQSSGGSAGGVTPNYSRWGIMGTSEFTEGLTAVYRFEQTIDSSNASQTGGRLSNVGLSVGIGTVTAGHF